MPQHSRPHRPLNTITYILLLIIVVGVTCSPIVYSATFMWIPFINQDSGTQSLCTSNDLYRLRPFRLIFTENTTEPSSTESATNSQKELFCPYTIGHDITFCVRTLVTALMSIGSTVLVLRSNHEIIPIVFIGLYICTASSILITSLSDTMNILHTSKHFQSSLSRYSTEYNCTVTEFTCTVFYHQTLTRLVSGAANILLGMALIHRHFLSISRHQYQELSQDVCTEVSI